MLPQGYSSSKKFILNYHFPDIRKYLETLLFGQMELGSLHIH